MDAGVVMLPVRPPVRPMLGRAVPQLPDGDGWVFEPKWDGFRTLAFVAGGDVDLRARTGTASSRYFPEIVAGLAPLADRRLVLDGEILAFRDGEPDFSALLLRIHPAASRVAQLAEETPAAYVVFDLLADGDDDLRSLPFAVRRAALERRPDLVWAGQISAIELHPYLHRVATPQQPQLLAFDLDPGPPAGAVEAARVALLLRPVLDALGLDSFPKTSGMRGIHLYVPLGGTSTYHQTKAFARAVAQLLVEGDPSGITAERGTSARVGKVFVDWGQNDQWKSMVAPYSLRGASTATVSTPLTWGEVEEAAASRDPSRLVFTPDDVLRRLDAIGDPFAEVPARTQEIPDVGRS